MALGELEGFIPSVCLQQGAANGLHPLVVVCSVLSASLEEVSKGRMQLVRRRLLRQKSEPYTFFQQGFFAWVGEEVFNEAVGRCKGQVAEVRAELRAGRFVELFSEVLIR